jgi:flagellar motor switch protein FliN/FliY
MANEEVGKDAGPISQEMIDQVMAGAAAQPAATETPMGSDMPGAGQEALDAVESIENQLGEVLSNLDGLAGGTGPSFSAMGAAATDSADGAANIDLLRDVQLNVKIELGRSKMYIEDILKLSEGHVVELDKLAGDPVDVFVNDRLVARGEVLVLNDNFCVRIGEIIQPE